MIGKVIIKKHYNNGLVPPYQTFLSELLAHLDGSIDTARFEECCRQVLGTTINIIIIIILI